MRREAKSSPTIRILLLGPSSVGKGSLEARFATGQWPSPYDPSLTLCSRRLYTLQFDPRPETSIVQGPLPAPMSTEQTDQDNDCNSPSPLPSPLSASIIDVTPRHPLSTRADSTSGPGTIMAKDVAPVRPQTPCFKCARMSQTHLVEIINYPALQSKRVRQKVLLKGEYDAIFLVYDVTDWDSLDHIKRLYTEIVTTVCTKRHQGSWISQRDHGSQTGASVQSRHQGRVSPIRRLFTSRRMTGEREAFAQTDSEESAGGSGTRMASAAVVVVVGNKRDVDGPEEFVFRKRESSHVIQDDFEKATYLDEGPVRLSCPVFQSIEGSSANGKEEAAIVTIQEHEETFPTGRAVSAEGGERLVLDCDAAVSFFETSAKTGENVDEAFGAVVRAVLEGRGKT